MSGLVVKIIRMCEREDSGAEAAHEEREKRRRELWWHRRIGITMGYVERVVGCFYSDDNKYRQER